MLRLCLATGVCLLLVGTTVHGQPLVTDGLTLYYSFDEVDEDGVWVDGSGNGLHGQTTFGFEDANEDDLDDIRLDTEDKMRGAGSVWFDTDAEFKEDYIGVCDPATDFIAGCEIADANGLIPEDGFTIATWVKVEDVGQDHSIWQSQATGGGFIHTQVQGNGNVRMRLRGDANSDTVVAYNQPPGGSPIEFETWFHYAGTYQVAEGEDFGEWAFYIDGEQVDSGDAEGDFPLGDWGTAAYVGLVPDFNRQLVGRLDDYYLFRRGLSAEEIKILFDAEQPLTGDYDGSGSLDAADLDVLAQYAIDGNLAGDVDGSGVVDVADRVAWVTTIQNSWIGDVNFDGEFNSGDIVAAFTAGKYETGEAAGYAEGDLDGNMLFDSGDLVVAFGEGGFEQGPRVAVAAVPEPASLVLVGVGLLGLMMRRRQA